jgi:feruloyl esterase
MVLATGNAAWTTAATQATFNANTMYDSVKFGLLAIGADHDKDAIARYVSSGKKLISWHSGSDNLLSINDHLRNWKTMIQSAARNGLADTRTASRFFVVPGAPHAGGQNLTEVDWATAIMDWVEKSVAPTQMTYKFTKSGVAKSLPVCEYPKYARYNGSGDVNDAANFTCTAP